MAIPGTGLPVISRKTLNPAGFNMNINSNTELYGIFGMPVRHSLSPVLHNAAFLQAGINAVYLAFEPGTIKEALDSMRTLKIMGASITIPFKVDAIELLDEIDPVSEKIGSVNTIKNLNGILRGYNTDGAGAVKAIEDLGIGTEGSKVLIIGNGGSARAVAFTLLDSGSKLVIAGRNPERVEALAGDLKRHGNHVDTALLSDTDGGFMKDVDIVINTTSVGMSPDSDNTPIDCGLISARNTVFDIVYNPHETRLIRESMAKGCRVIHGIDMLINQAARQFEIWMGMKAPAGIYRETAYRHIF